MMAFNRVLTPARSDRSVWGKLRHFTPTNDERFYHVLNVFSVS